MGFNPSWPDQYQPTDIKNTFEFVGEVAQFSNSNDVIAVLGDDSLFPETIRGKYVLLHSGDDEYYGTRIDSPGWDNIANGNRGNDKLYGLGDSRDFLRGGKDDDSIVGRSGGNDFLLGDAGDDSVNGSKTGDSILRGGKGDDKLTGGLGRNLLVGDYGKDILTGSLGSDLFVLRTDTSSSTGLSNLTPNAIEADVIKDFTSDDYLVIPGVNAVLDVDYQWNNGNYLVRVRTDSGFQYAGIIESVGFAALPTAAQTIIGQTANNILAAADGDSNAFGNNPNLLGSFGI